MAADQPFAKKFSIPLIITLVSVVKSQTLAPEPTVLTPPYFNLAHGRNVEATATCGFGNVGQERYCKLSGADPTFDNEVGDVIQGQLCDVCVSEVLAAQLGNQDPSRRDYYRKRVHVPENAVDGTERWWQSPPLSRGLQYNEVNVTVDLGQVSVILSQNSL